MKKARLISLIALTLCFMIVFASCGAGSALKYFDDDYDDEFDDELGAEFAEVYGDVGEDDFDEEEFLEEEDE